MKTSQLHLLIHWNELNEVWKMLIFVLTAALCVPYPWGIGTHTFLNMDHLRLGSNSKVMSLSGHKKKCPYSTWVPLHQTHISSISSLIEERSESFYSFFSLPFLKKKKKKIHCKEQVVKSNMTVNYLIRFVFIASNARCLTICFLCKTMVLTSTLIDLQAQCQLPRAETLQEELRQHFIR